MLTIQTEPAILFFLLILIAKLDFATFSLQSQLLHNIGMY